MYDSLFDLLITNLYEDVNHADTLEKELREAKSLRIVCPFVSLGGAKWLLARVKDECQIELITELSVRGVIAGVQDPEALATLAMKGHRVLCYKRKLHAKIYWIDRKKALITSANLTDHGLKVNFEMGVLVDPARFNSFKRPKDKGVTEHLEAVWSFVEKFSETLSEPTLDYFRALKSRSREAREQLESIAAEVELDTPGVEFERHQGPGGNRQLLVTNLQAGRIFGGFTPEQWDVFRTDLPLTPQSLEDFKRSLTETINPILKRFYLQLKNETVFRSALGTLDVGYSENRQLKSSYPKGRYLFLTKPRLGKQAGWHIGEPSFIVGMGLNGDDKWLDVRTGVEEEYLPRLSHAGENLLRNILSNVDEVMIKLRSLGRGWQLEHGIKSDVERERLDLETLNSATLSELVKQGLESGKIADLAIRRVYHLSNELDRKIVLSPQVTSAVAKDMERLKYFHDLAHGSLK